MAASGTGVDESSGVDKMAAIDTIMPSPPTAFVHLARGACDGQRPDSEPEINAAVDDFAAHATALLSNVGAALLVEHDKAIAAREQSLQRFMTELCKTDEELRRRLGRPFSSKVERESEMRKDFAGDLFKQSEPIRMSSKEVSNGSFARSVSCGTAGGCASRQQDSRRLTNLSVTAELGSPAETVDDWLLPPEIIVPGEEMTDSNAAHHITDDNVVKQMSDDNVVRQNSSFGRMFELRDVFSVKSLSRLESRVLEGSSANSFANSVELSGMSYVANAGCRQLYKTVFGTSVYGMMSPSSPFFLVWNITFLVVLVYELMMFPMAAFDLPQTQFLFAIQIFTLTFWSLDVIVAVSVGFYDSTWELVVDRCQVLRNYARTWMIPDLAILTVDYMLLAMIDDDMASSAKFLRFGKAIRYLRAIRLLRLLRLKKLSEAVQLLDEFINSEMFSIIEKMLLNVLAILVISHFIGCLWFWIGSLKIPSYPSWVFKYDFDGTAWEYQYLTSFHWAITQMTPGSMHVQPQNVPERFYAIMVLVMGMIVFSSIVSSITAATNQLKSISAKYDRERFTMRMFFLEREISASLTARVTRYADTIIKPQMKKISVYQVDLLRQLPKSMYMDVMLELYDQDLIVHPFFFAMLRQSSIVMKKICTSVIECLRFAEGDFLFHFGEGAEAMYFVTRGKLEYQHRQPHRRDHSEAESEHGLPVHHHHHHHRRCYTLEGGQWICEAVLWTPWMHSGDLRTQSDAEVLTIEHHRFEAVIKKYHSSLWLARKYGIEFVRRLNEIYCETEREQGRHSSIHLSDLLVIHEAILKLPTADGC